jgi:hypothetical protein
MVELIARAGALLWVISVGVAYVRGISTGRDAVLSSPSVVNDARLAAEARGYRKILDYIAYPKENQHPDDDPRAIARAVLRSMGAP